MKRVLTLFFLLCSLLAEDKPVPRTEIPNPVPVFTEITNVYMEGNKTVKQTKTHEIQLMTLADWVKQYGVLTEADRLQYVQFGALRRAIILHHYTL